MSRRDLPIPPPLEGNDELITAVITAGWVIAMIVVLVLRDRLAPADRWWIWVTACGSGIGLFGLVLVPWLKRSRRRTAARRAARRAASQ
ncbi:MAG: DUF2530 domain-containing protein [Streptosporangiaceae bacterium]